MIKSGVSSYYRMKGKYVIVCDLEIGNRRRIAVNVTNW
jgi:hypothetical protein